MVQQGPSLLWNFSDGDRVASLNSRFAVNMCFTNRTRFLVEAIWLNFNGEEVSYGFVKPGRMTLLYTYLTHPWVFRVSDETRDVLLVNGKSVVWPSQLQTFGDVVEAPCLPWSPATHASDFRRRAPDFARDVRNLLLAYNAQRRSPDMRSSAAGIRRHSRGGATTDDSASPTSAAVGCCGVRLWHWRGLEECNALHATLCSYPVIAHHADRATPSEADDDWQELEHGLLGQLPFDVILEIVKRMAPPLREVQPVLKDDMVLMPRGVQPATGPVALMAAQMLGPFAPPPPAAQPDAWFHAAAAGLGHDAGGPLIGGPLALGALVGAPQPVHAVNGPQQPPHVGLADVPAALAPEMVAVMQYMDAMALANAAMMHVDAMAQHQEEEAAVLLARIQTTIEQLAAAAAALEQQQEPAGQQPGDNNGQPQDQPGQLGQQEPDNNQEQQQESDDPEVEEILFYDPAPEIDLPAPDIDLPAELDGGVADGNEEPGDGDITHEDDALYSTGSSGLSDV